MSSHDPTAELVAPSASVQLPREVWDLIVACAAAPLQERAAQHAASRVVREGRPGWILPWSAKCEPAAWQERPDVCYLMRTHKLCNAISQRSYNC